MAASQCGASGSRIAPLASRRSPVRRRSAASVLPPTPLPSRALVGEQSYQSQRSHVWLSYSRETAAQENASSYFPLLDRIAEGRFSDFATDKELFDGFVAVLRADGHVADPEALSAFQLALSIHAAAPRIEAHYQYYNTSVQSTLMVAQDAACPVWVHADGKQYCSPTLERPQQDYEGLR